MPALFVTPCNLPGIDSWPTLVSGPVLEWVRQLYEIEDRVKQEISMMPLGIVGNLNPEQLADLIAYLESLH